MTREIGTHEREKRTRNANTGSIVCRTAPAAQGRKTNTRSKNVTIPFAKAVSFYRKAVRLENEIYNTFFGFFEALADKTAREGLFGEDRGKGYAGTDVDYIE